MAGYSNQVATESGMKVLLRGFQNSLGIAAADALTKDNSAVFANAPRGILSGSVVAVAGSGLIGAGTAAATSPVVGLAVEDAVGHPYESSSAAGSGKIVYICGAGCVVSVDRFEEGANPIAAGDNLRCSANGFLINEGTGTVVAVVLEAPTASNPRLVAQLRI